MACFLITGLICNSNADGVGVLGVGWLGLSLFLAGGYCVGRDVLCEAVNKTGLSSGLCQCCSSQCCGLTTLGLLGWVIKGLAVLAEVALISCIACWK